MRRHALAHLGTDAIAAVDHVCADAAHGSRKDVHEAIDGAVEASLELSKV